MTNILTRKEVADYLKIGMSTLDRLIHKKDHPIPHIATGRRILIPQSELEKWITEEANKEGN